MTHTSEFIVEQIDNEETLKFFEEIQRANDKQTKTLIQPEDYGGHLPKKFTSMATNATTFRWKFGDKPGNPTIETTVNPYIHRFINPGTYEISHQSCYACPSTGTLTCSTGWCTKTITVIEEHGIGSLVALGIGGLFLAISRGDNCCTLRRECEESRRMCNTTRPEDIKDKEKCKSTKELCTTKLESCRVKCINTGNDWESSSYKCHEKNKPVREICQIIENKKRRKQEKNNIRQT